MASLSGGFPASAISLILEVDQAPVVIAGELRPAAVSVSWAMGVVGTCVSGQGGGRVMMRVALIQEAG